MVITDFPYRESNYLCPNFKGVLEELSWEHKPYSLANSEYHCPFTKFILQTKLYRKSQYQNMD